MSKRKKRMQYPLFGEETETANKNEEMKEDEQDKDNSFDHFKDVTAALKRGKRNASKEKR